MQRLSRGPMASAAEGHFSQLYGSLSASLLQPPFGGSFPATREALEQQPQQPPSPGADAEGTAATFLLTHPISATKANLVSESLRLGAARDKQQRASVPTHPEGTQLTISPAQGCEMGNAAWTRRCPRHPSRNASAALRLAAESKAGRSPALPFSAFLSSLCN